MTEADAEDMTTAERAGVKGAEEMSWRTTLPVSAEKLFAWHESSLAFERLTPAYRPVRVLGRFGGLKDGSRVSVSLPVGPIRLPWEVEHVDYIAGRQFIDVQRRGPFSFWEHRHLIEPGHGSGESSELEDRIRYRIRFGALGKLVADRYIRRELNRLISWRHHLLKIDHERHNQFAGNGPLRIAVTGAQGLVGSALVPFLTTGGHEVTMIGRDGRSDVRWVPQSGELDGAPLEGMDAVVHLAGAPIADRWTAAHRRLIKDSRVQSTRLIAERCAALGVKPKVLVCASAVGYYGDRGDELLLEESSAGSDYLSTVGREWEAAADAARQAGIRVVHLRIGIVLTPAGGALGKMLLPFRLGFGGKLGSGRQWMSWISREDLIGAIHEVIQSDRYDGAVNVVAPQPVTNAEFVSTLGDVLRRPTIASVPASVLRAIFGEMAQATILSSQRVVPGVLNSSGFTYRFPDLEGALRFELGLHRST